MIRSIPTRVRLFTVGAFFTSFLAGITLAADSAVIAPGDQLQLEGVPAIPATLAEEMRPYTEARGAVFLSWHPERAEMLISTRFANTAQLHHVAMPGGARRQITFFQEPVGAGSYDPTTGRTVLFGKDQGGNEFSQIYRLDLQSGLSRLLTDGGRSQNGGIRWNQKRDAFAYSSTRRNGADRDVWVMDPNRPETNRLAISLKGGGWSVGDWSPDDSQLVLGEYVSASKSALWLANSQTGALSRLTPEGADAVFGAPRFSKDGREVFCITDQGSDFQHLAVIEKATGKVMLLSKAIPWDVESYDLSADGSRLVFTTNENGLSKLYMMDAVTRRFSEVPGVPVGVISGAEWHPKLPLVGFTLASARTTSDAYVLDAGTGKVIRWTESELGGLNPEQLSIPELVSWKSFDGRDISGFLYRAPAKFSGKRPLIINIHGGPEGQSFPTFIGTYNYLLNELGVSILFPNVRGSTGYGRSFEQLDNVFRREDSVRDISALLDWIPSQPHLDAERVMVMGGSYGGYMALAVSVAESARIRCSIDIVGISHFGTFLKNTEAYRRDLRRVEYGDERDPKVSEFFEKISPLNRATAIKKPLFVVQGANDPRVPQSEADQIVAKVKSQGTPVWYLVAKDEGHGFRKKNNRDFLFYAQILFVRQFLLGQGEGK